MTQTCPVFPRGPLNPAGPVRLVCLPFAGGNATAYASLERALADIAEVRVPELPGRGTRFGEAFATDLPTVAAEIAGALRAMPQKPLVLFGHSLGTLIAYEVARTLAAAGGAPRHLVLSGRRAPLTGEGPLAEEALTDAALEARMRRLGGTPPELFAARDLLALVLPVVRADYRLASQHVPDPTSQLLGLPATILGGDADLDNPPGLLPGWGAWLGRAPAVQIWPGGHFFIRAQGERLAALLRDVIAAEAPAP